MFDLPKANFKKNLTKPTSPSLLKKEEKKKTSGSKSSPSSKKKTLVSKPASPSKTLQPKVVKRKNKTPPPTPDLKINTEKNRYVVKTKKIKSPKKRSYIKKSPSPP